MNRSRPATLTDYSQQLAINRDELDKRERLNICDVINHGYLQRILRQYESFGLQSDTLLFATVTALGAISKRSFINNHNNIPVMLNHGSVIVGKTGANKSNYIKLIRHAINTLTHHFESTYYPNIDKDANKIDHDQVSGRHDQESSSTSSKMLKASFMIELSTELAITKNLATMDTFLCHDEGDVILSTLGFYTPSDTKHAAGINLLCSGLDGLFDYKRTTGHQCINVKDSHLSILLATTGSKMSSTLQVMHQKKENVGVLGRLNFWYLPSSQVFIPPQQFKIIRDIASIDHLLIIGHELFQYSPEIRFKKHASDVEKKHIIVEDEYMKSLRREQGINNDENSSNLSHNHHDFHLDIFDPCPDDLTESGDFISAYKLMISIMNSEFKVAQQMEEHLVDCVPKATYKFPRICALLCILEIIGEIASNLLKYIVFDEGNFARPHLSSNKYISLEFVCVAHQYVKHYVSRLPVINGRPIIYINKLQVERTFTFYTYMETTMTMLFDASFINPGSQIVQEINATNPFAKQEKQDIAWIIKVLRTPVIFFSNNYLCKSIPGCAGSGVLKNTSTEVRVHIMDIMKVYGLITIDDYLSSMKTNSFAKVPPSVVRQNESLVKLFTKFGPSFTLNIYEKIFETFGLLTTSNFSIVPITSTGIKLLRENNSYVNYYHCLNKDERVLNMIKERLNLKEICLISYKINDSHRYELIDPSIKIIQTSSEDVNDNCDERTDSHTQLISVSPTTDHVQQQQQFSSADEDNDQEKEQQQPNDLLLVDHIVGNVNLVEAATIIIPNENQNNVLISGARHHSDISRHIQRQTSDSSISNNSRISSLNISFSSADHHMLSQNLPLSSSPLPSDLFEEALNINNSTALNHMEIDDLSTILEEENDSLSNVNIDQSDIQFQLVSPVIETTKFTTQPFIVTDDSVDATTISHINHPDIVQPNGSLEHLTSGGINTSDLVHSTVMKSISTNSVNPITLSLPLISVESQSEHNIGEYRSSDALPVSLFVASNEATMEPPEIGSSISIVSKKRGRKPNIGKNHTSSPVEDPTVIENILANCKHPIYKRLILIQGLVFSKSDFTHATQQYPDLRDGAIQKLVNENVFTKKEVFAKRTSSGVIEYLDGYIKQNPMDIQDISSDVEEGIKFANILASHDITSEEYIDSFNNKQLSVQDGNGEFNKNLLNRSHITLKSYLFSSKFLDFINGNSYFCERYTIDEEAICHDKPSMIPTMSNTSIDEYQQMQVDQLKQRTMNKRIYNQIQDNTGSAPKNSRRRP